MPAHAPGPDSGPRLRWAATFRDNLETPRPEAEGEGNSGRCSEHGPYLRLPRASLQRSGCSARFPPVSSLFSSADAGREAYATGAVVAGRRTAKIPGGKGASRLRRSAFLFDATPCSAAAKLRPPRNMGLFFAGASRLNTKRTDAGWDAHVGLNGGRVRVLAVGSVPASSAPECVVLRFRVGPVRAYPS